MNILFVTPFFKPQTGGVVTYIDDLRNLLSEKGHNMYVLRAGEPNAVTECPLSDDSKVFEFNMRVPWISTVPIKAMIAFLVYFIPTVWRLTRFMRERRIQLVSLEYPMPYMLYFYVLRPWTRVPIVVGLHGSDLLLLETNDPVWQWIVRRMIRHADWILAHSSSLLNEAQSRIKKIGHKSSYLHLGVDCARLHRLANRPTNMSDTIRSGFILTVAKLYPRKGLDVLLEAIHKLKHAHSQYQFVIAGDGPEEVRLKQAAADLGIHHCVHFLGDVGADVIPVLFKNCEFFVLPSRVEPFGIVLLEAMVFGKAIVATTAGGIPEFIKDGHNGLLVATEDSQSLAEKIDRLICDKNLRETIGKNGRMVVEQQYNYDRLVVKYEELFKEQVRQH